MTHFTTYRFGGHRFPYPADLPGSVCRVCGTPWTEAVQDGATVCPGRPARLDASET